MDGLERHLQGKALVMRVNLNESVGSEMAKRLGIHSVPTFIILNSGGDEIWRKWGFPNRSTIIEVINRIS